jgi:uncharacterized SAM-binding protein YcdF (DUF218 family)
MSVAPRIRESAGDAPPRRGRPRALVRLLGVIAFTVVAVALPPLLLGLGFLWFVWRLPADEVAITRNADGIVVLTGGPSRIADAIDLLAAGRGRRLLITGVHPTTNLAEIARLVPETQRTLASSIDLDHEAINTVGNAIETKRWIRERGYRSVIVVTSNYHMPRAMAELANQLPGITLIPFPVVTERLRAEPWWSSSTTARLLFAEYTKYVLAVTRIWLETEPGGEPNRPTERRARAAASTGALR